MTKRILSFILALAAVTAFFAVDAGAAIADAKLIYEQDFTRPEGAAEGWAPESWIFSYIGGSASLQNQAIAEITEEGYIDLNKGGFDGAPAITATMPSLPSDFTLTYDVNNYADSKASWIVCSLNGYNQTATGGGHVEYLTEAGENTSLTLTAECRVWYTYVFQVKGDRMSIFRKERDNAEADFVSIVENVKMKTRSGHVFYAYCSGANAGMYIDNVKLYAGTYVTAQNIEVVENGGNKKLVGTMEVASADINPTSPRTVMTLMGIYDERGRIIDMVVESAVLKYGEDNLFVIETREYTVSEYEKMVGNTVEMYIWESFSTMTPQKAIYSTMLR